MARRVNYEFLGTVLTSCTLILSVIAMMFESVAIVLGYDKVMRVFKLQSKVATVSVVALFVLSIAMGTLAICVGKIAKMRPKAQNSAATDTVGIVGGLSLAVSSVLFLVDSLKVADASALKFFTILLVVISVPTALSYIVGVEKTKLSTFLAFFPPLWNATCLVRLYFDAGTAINDPVRILLQITLVAVMLALMYELKLRVYGTGKIMFTMTATIATVLSSASFAAILLLSVLLKVETTANLLLAVGTLLSSAYLLIRLDMYYKAARPRD